MLSDGGVTRAGVAILQSLIYQSEKIKSQTKVGTQGQIRSDIRYIGEVVVIHYS